MTTTTIRSENPIDYFPSREDKTIADALEILSRRLMRAGDVMDSSGVVKNYLTLRIAALEYEVFLCLFLTTQHRVIACEELFRGTIDGASVWPREVVKRALALNAAAVIFAHNHPSGQCIPSQDDKNLTVKLRDACALVGIHALDHIVIGGTDTLSFAEAGMM